MLKEVIKKVKTPVKMRTKILTLCIVSTLIALISLTALFQNSSSELLYEQTKQTTLNDIQNMQDDIYNVIKSVEINLTEIYNEDMLISDLDHEKTITQLRANYYNVAYNIALNYFEPTDGVSALYLYDNSKRLISTYRRAVAPAYNFPIDPYENPTIYRMERVDQYLESPEATMLVSGYYNRSRGQNILRYVLKLYSKNDINKMVGFVVCDTDSTAIEKIIKKYESQNQSMTWIQPLNDIPLILSAKTPSEANENSCEMIQERICNGEQPFNDKVMLNNSVLFRVPQSKYNLEAFSLVPQDLLIENQKALMESTILIAVAMFGICIFVSVIFTKTITNPLEKLTDTIDSIKSGNTKQRAQYLKNDEIGELGQSFNEMLDEIDVLIAQKYQTEILLNQAKYKALQAQINPHFLYNTLDTMSSISEAQGNQMVSTLSQALSNIFRYSLDMKHPMSTVAKEIIHLKNYIYVMNVRMGNEVTYEFDIDERVLQNILPRISLQPIVENALKHGLRNKRGKKVIRVSAQIIENKLQIIVFDNGVGMDADQLNEKLKNTDLDFVEQGNSIGLVNINARVKLLFGDEYGLNAVSQLNHGTSVLLTIPRKWEYDS